MVNCNSFLIFQLETVEKMRLVSFEHKSEKYFLESIKKKKVLAVLKLNNTLGSIEQGMHYKQNLIYFSFM